MDRASRYTADINLAAVNDAHVFAIGRVPARSRVLDLGAADGSVAAVLRSMGCQVWGVEQDPDAAQAAKRWCESVHIGDLNAEDLREVFADLRFEVILMLDVLEHLSDPARVLREVRDLLAPGGWAVISLPNVTHISLRLELLSGRFVYRDAGLLDRTHVRFFDSDGVKALLDESGWEAFDTERVVKRLGETEIDVQPPSAELLQRIEEDPEAYTYQFVVSAAPRSRDAGFEAPTLPAAAAQRVAAETTRWAQHLRSVAEGLGVEVEDLRSEIASLRAEVSSLRSGEYDPVVGDKSQLIDQLEAIRNGSVDRRRQLADLLVALREDTERLRLTISQ